MGSEASTGNVRPLPDRSRAVETLDGLPLMLTVDEAAAVLGISRTTAYKLVELHRTTAGWSAGKVTITFCSLMGSIVLDQATDQLGRAHDEYVVDVREAPVA